MVTRLNRDERSTYIVSFESPTSFVTLKTERHLHSFDLLQTILSRPIPPTSNEEYILFFMNLTTCAESVIMRSHLDLSANKQKQAKTYFVKLRR